MSKVVGGVVYWRFSGFGFGFVVHMTARLPLQSKTQAKGIRLKGPRFGFGFTLTLNPFPASYA
jgi:hypothetical protein